MGVEFKREVHPKNVECLAKRDERVKVITLATPGEVGGFLKRIERPPENIKILRWIATW